MLDQLRKRITLIDRDLLIATAAPTMFVAALCYMLLPMTAPYLLFGCALVPLLWLLRDGRPRPPLRGDALSLALMALLVWSAVTMIWSPGGLTGWRHGRGW